MPVRGIRGAIVADKDHPESILEATRDLLEAISRSNPNLMPEDIASVIFTTTGDLSSEYPAKAARQLGWLTVPLFCSQEIPVPEGLHRCIRVLIHWNTEQPQAAVKHVYLGEAAKLRPDL